MSSPEHSSASLLPPSVALAVRDIDLWRVRVLARTFYPDVAAAAASIALPLSVQTWLEQHDDYPVAIDHVGTIQDLIAQARDAGAALAAQGVTGRKPSFDQYKNFNALIDDLLGRLHDQGGNHTEDVSLAPYVETSLQKFMRSQESGGV